MPFYSLTLKLYVYQNSPIAIYITEEVWKNCEGEAQEHLEMLCMKLPEERCIEGPIDMTMCEEHEFDCGNGQCIHGLGVCDSKYQCKNGADELEW